MTRVSRRRSRVILSRRSRGAAKDGEGPQTTKRRLSCPEPNPRDTPNVSPLWKPSGELQLFYLYIMSNNSMTLYTGITNDIRARAAQHKRGEGSRFTARYHFDRLVWYEEYADVKAAIAREKQIKGWMRKKKIALVKSMNPGWKDLSADWELVAF